MSKVEFFYSGWQPLVRILLVGTLGYTWLVLILRTTGPRNLATMTPFDFVITVTLGSAFGRVLTAKEVSLADAVVAFTLLIALQWGFASARSRWPAFGRLVDVPPTLLFHAGNPVNEGLRRHRMTESDLHSAVREQGYGSLQDVEAIVLQSDGTLAVLPRSQMGDGSSLLPFVRA